MVKCKLQRYRESQKQESKLMHKKINELSSHATSSTYSSGGCIKSKDGTMLMEKGKIIARWTEYIQELFEDEREAMPQIRKEKRHGRARNTER